MNAETSPALSPNEVALRVRPHIVGRHLGAIVLTLDEACIHLRDGYWNIPVRPSRWPNPLFLYYDLYYEMLAEIEDEVQEREGLKVTIASGEPLTES